MDCSLIKIGSAQNDIASALPLATPSLMQTVDKVICPQDPGFYLPTSIPIPTATAEVFVYIEAGTGITFNSGTAIPEDTIGSEVNVLTPDTTLPEISSFALLDLARDELTITFSEAVDITSFDPSLLVLQSSAGSGGSSVTLSTSTTQNINLNMPTTMVVNLNIDAHRIKLFNDLAVDQGTTFLSTSAGMITDLSGNNNVEIDVNSALQVNQYISDNVSPELIAFDLDLTQNTLTLSFNEPVFVSPSVTSHITIQDSSSSPTAFYQLTTPSSITGRVGPLVPLQLSNEDANAIKLVSGLAKSAASTFLSASANMVVDLNGNGGPPAITLPVSTYARDTVSPILVAFDLNLLAYKLQLEFNEPVLAASLQPTEITIQSTSSADATSFELTMESVASPSNVNGNLQVINLNGDGESLKFTPNLANDVADTFLTCGSNLIRDTFANLVVPILSSVALKVSNYTRGLYGPEVDSFLLDLTSNELVLTFSEQVVISSVTPSAIVIQSTADGSGASVKLTELSTVVLVSGEATVVAIALNGDANALKKTLNLATSSNDTFLSWTNNLAKNLEPEDVIPRGSSNALAVTTYRPDRDNPELQAFVLDLDADQLEMTFNEPILARTINSFLITLLYDLTTPNIAVNGFVNIINTPVVSDVLTTPIFYQSLNEMKAYYAMNSVGANAHIRFVEGAFLDTNSNPVGPQTVSGTVVMDASPPRLSAFSLDLNVGTIILSFDEVIDISSLNIAGSLSILKEPSDVNPYTLTGGNVPVGDNSVVMISLSKTDLNAIKAMTSPDTGAGNTLIAIKETLLQDLNGNAVFPIANNLALRVSNFTEDVTPPSLVYVQLDLNDKDIELTFDEPVDPSSVTFTSLTFMWRRDDGSNTNYSLSGGIVSETNLTEIVTKMSLHDFDSINCFTSQTFDAERNTFLELKASAVLDFNGNAIQKEVVTVNEIVEDTLPPNLKNFEMDLDLGTLHLTFEESVVPSTLVPSLISLQSMAGPNPQTVTLTTASSTSSTDTVLVIILSTRDLNEIKRHTNIATMTNNTYVSIGRGVVKDCAGNLATALSPTSALRAGSYISDITSPVLVHFSLDLDEGELVLLFSEVVNVLSFTPTAITIQGLRSVSTVSTTIASAERFLVLKGGITESSDDIEITLSLNATDLLVLQKSSEVAVDENTTFLSMNGTALCDTSGNQVIQIPSTQALQVNVFYPDAPDIVQSQQGGKFAALSWSVPVGPAILNYTVKWERSTARECPDKDIGSLTLNNDRTSIIIQGLEEDSAYNVIVESSSLPGVATSDPVTIITLETGKFIR